jgi:hypothetical protein
MAGDKTSVDGVHTTPAVVHDSRDDKQDINKVERVLSAEDAKVDHLNYDRVDEEVAQYAGAAAIEVSEEDNKRLKRMIDRRVLPIMVITYFLQSLDKGTMSATSIMGIRDDIPVLKKNQVVSKILLGLFIQQIANFQLHSLDGSPPVSTWLCCSSNTRPTGSSSVSL